MNLRPAFLLAVILSMLASCTKIESTDIGAGLIPPVDNIHTFDTTLEVITENQVDTGSIFPLRTDNLALGRVSNDPLFGKTTGIVNLQFFPEYSKFRFTGLYNELQLDSMVLVLAYKGVWGDTMTNQTLQVYEISQSNVPTIDSAYATRKRFAHQSTVLGSTTVDVKKLLKDTLKPNGEIVNKNQIRIRLTDPSFQQRMFKDTTILDSDSLFKTKIAGLAVVPDTSGVGNPNSLMLVNLSDTNTKIAFYYSYKLVADSPRKSTVSYFRFSGRSAFSNNIIRNPVGAEYVSHLKVANDNLAYLQTRPDAPYTRIRIPGLNDLKNRIVHRAELQLTQVPNTATGDMDRFFSPPALFLAAYSTDSSKRFMLPGGDVQFSNTGVSNLADFGAFPYSRNIGGQQTAFYSFNLTRYVQSIATQKYRNYEMVIWAPFADYVQPVENFNTLLPIAGSGVMNALAVGRVRVGGGSHTQSPMRLRIIYTRL